MIGLFRRIVQAVIEFCQRGKPAAEAVPGRCEDHMPLWIVLAVGDQLVMTLSRQREAHIEYWLWRWPLQQIERLELRIEQQATSPDGWLDWRDAKVAKKQAGLIAREWREGAKAEGAEDE